MGLASAALPGNSGIRFTSSKVCRGDSRRYARKTAPGFLPNQTIVAELQPLDPCGTPSEKGTFGRDHS
ncbi:hypothetical protein SBA2_460033 [Acidobacteriia bacterium SbA2]|nr:hypothetical protein SBA2_460033 [Acidobacteriia bacterium SbA2]